MSRESKKVAYVGTPGVGDLAVGEVGTVVSDGGNSAHVRWLTGARAGSIDLVDTADLVVHTGRVREASASPSFDDALSVPTLTTVAVRETYEAEGEAGLLNALGEAGLLAGMAQIAEDALTFVAQRLRDDTEMASVLAQLDAEEGSNMVRLASVVLLRDAFGGDDA